MKAILVGVTTKYDKYDIEYSLNELEALAKVLDIDTVFKITQNLDSPNTKTYIGTGKVNEVIIAINAYDADIVIFNDELTPSQLKHLEEALNKEVIDRSYLILKIFETRAKTKESSLEVKLAKDLYLLPRLELLKGEESRIGGGLYNKGAGETQKELDRRHVMAEINHIKEELLNIKRMKSEQIKRRKRNDIPIVSLVGYTNSGKSSTMNTILEYSGSSKEVLAKDQLFATLDTANKKITIDNKDFILVDTVGFVSKLPHGLVNSFFQTLEEIRYSDLIIVVLDSSSPYIKTQYSVVMGVLEMLKVLDIPTIYLLNKWENTISDSLNIIGKKTIQFSNKTKLNLDELITEILSEISKNSFMARLLIPYDKGNLSNILEEKTIIYKKEFQASGTYFEVEIPTKIYHLFKDYDLDDLVS